MLKQDFTNGGLDNKDLQIMAQTPKKKVKKQATSEVRRKKNTPAFFCWPVTAECTHSDTVERDICEDIYDDFSKYYQFRKRLLENPKSLYTRKETITKFCQTLDSIPRVGMSKRERGLLNDPKHVEEVLNGPHADLDKIHFKFARKKFAEKQKYLEAVWKAK